MKRQIYRKEKKIRKAVMQILAERQKGKKQKH